MKNISNLTVKEFRENKSSSLRIHTLKWAETSEPGGYAHLTEQLQQCEPWQFGLSVNEHGRVHGLLIDEVFYVVWLDVNHRMYP
ncbi:hypothetical protein A8H35_02770 [Burkholderia thailandensis]|nr:hypothetical protein A8H35_02770 [Burkholderia thailandensis]AWY69546.1 hypothetical protein A8H36_25545 [Burkholderia thailandensis]